MHIEQFTLTMVVTGIALALSALAGMSTEQYLVAGATITLVTIVMYAIDLIVR